MSMWDYPHPDPNISAAYMARRSKSEIRLFEYNAFDDTYFHTGGDPLTDFVEPPIVREEENGIYDLTFTYKIDGEHAEKIDYFRIIVCPVPIYWEEMFYIHDIEKDLETIRVVAKHITFLADRVPLNEIKQKNATALRAGQLVYDNMRSNPQDITFRSDVPVRQDLHIPEDTTVRQFIRDTWLNLYGGTLWRSWREVRLLKRRGVDTQVQIAKYKNLRDRNWVGNIDNVTTRAHVRAEIDREWLLPEVTGEKLTDSLVGLDQKGQLYISAQNIASNAFIDRKMRFSVYDANGNKIDTFDTHDRESVEKQSEDVARWTEDLNKKREQLPASGATDGAKRITISKTINVYTNGADAVAKRNVAGTVPKGTYYVWGSTYIGGYNGNENVYPIEDKPGTWMARGWVNLSEDDKHKIDETWSDDKYKKLADAIAELEQKLARADLGYYGRRIMRNVVPGTYTIVMERAPDGFYADYWPRTDVVVTTDTQAEVRFFLWPDNEDGARTSKPFLTTVKDSPLINDYPVIMDGFFTISDPAIITQEALDAYAESLFSIDHVDLIMEDFTVDPDDLLLLETFNIGSTALLYFEDSDVDKRIACVGYEWDVLRKEFVSYTFGKKREGLAGVLGRRMREWYDELSKEATQRAERAAQAVNRGVGAIETSVRGDIAQLNSELDFRVRSLEAEMITTDELYAAYAEIDHAVIEKADIEQLAVEQARIESLEATAITTDYLHANYLKSSELETKYATIENLNVVDAKITNLTADFVSTAHLEAYYTKTTDLEATYATIENLNASNATIGNLVTREAEISILLAGNLTADNMQAGFITADSGLIGVGAISTAMIQDAAITSAQLADASITDAHIVELTANKITAGTLSVDRLEIRGSENSIVYQLNNITGALQAQNVDTLNGEIVTPRSITADKIVAKSITGEEIKAKSITANELAANTITAESGVIASLDANKITAGTLDVARIGSRSITADKLEANIGQSLDLSSNVSISTTVSNVVSNQLGEVNTEVGELKDSVSVIKQTHEGITARITQTETGLGEQEEDLTGLRKDVETYFTFEADGMTIGKTRSLKQIVISNEQLAFKDNGQIVANIEGRIMNIDDVFVRYGLIVGVHKFEKYNENITLIRYVGSWS